MVSEKARGFFAKEQGLSIIFVLLHSLFEMLLRISDVDFPGFVACCFVNHYRRAAFAIVGTNSCCIERVFLAVARELFEISGFNACGYF